MEDNICKFVSTRTTREGISIISFVYEKNARFAPEMLLSAAYSVAAVTQGSGVLHTMTGAHRISAGDFFLTFSAQPYYIENVQDLHYIYITFVGSRAPALVDRLQAPQKPPVYHGLSFLQDLWENSVQSVTEENIDMLCEGLLLYTLSFICTQREENAPVEKASGMLLIKQYVDSHFTDSSLNLKVISERFAFHPKYLSGAFKKLVRLSFTEYLTEKRLSYALKLVQSGVSSVKELSELCGYSDALYFSKAFKRKYGVSPKQYMLRRES